MSQHPIASAPEDCDTNHGASDCDALRERLLAADDRDRLSLLEATGPEIADEILMELCLQASGPAAGKAHQLLQRSETPQARAFLAAKLAEGVVPLQSARAIAYQPLLQALVVRDYQTADRLTLQKLCELAGPDTVKRGWLYFTEVENLPVVDLQTVDRLWLAYSGGKFGFSVQRRLWLALGRNFEKLWPRIGWKEGNVWTRYPGGFVWDTSAPLGHLPLSNQLRGVRAFASLLTHPAWSPESQ